MTKQARVCLSSTKTKLWLHSECVGVTPPNETDSTEQLTKSTTHPIITAGSISASHPTHQSWILTLCVLIHSSIHPSFLMWLDLYLSSYWTKTWLQVCPRLVFGFVLVCFFSVIVKSHHWWDLDKTAACISRFTGSVSKASFNLLIALDLYMFWGLVGFIVGLREQLVRQSLLCFRVGTAPSQHCCLQELTSYMQGLHSLFLIQSSLFEH